MGKDRLELAPTVVGGLKRNRVDISFCPVNVEVYRYHLAYLNIKMYYIVKNDGRVI